MNGSSYETVKAQFDAKRAAAQDEAAQRKKRLSAESPEYKDVEAQIASLGAELLRMTQDLSEDRSERILQIKAKMKALRALRADILKGLGYPEDYVLPPYECKKCEDTGFVGINVCDCFKRALRTENYLSSGLGKSLVRQRFENFDLSLYTGGDRENMTDVFEFCREYAEGFSTESPSLLFIGGTGLGKTHLSSAIAMKIVDGGGFVVYDTAQHIFSVYEKNRFSHDDEETGKYTACDLLIIDDLGTELSGYMAESTLYTILNARMNAQLPTIINTNLKPQDLRNKYDDRIISRLFGQFRIMTFTGTDIRLKKLSQ